MTRKKVSKKKANGPAKRIVRPVVADPADRMRPPFRPTPPREQTDARFDLVRDLILGNVPRHLIHQALVMRTTPGPEDTTEAAADKLALAERIGWPFPPRQTEFAYERVRRQIAKAFESDLPTARAIQSARLEGDLLRVSQDIERTQPGRRGPLHHAKARYHDLLSQVQGTKAPTEIRVDPTLGARQTLIAVVMNMSPEEQERLVEEERRRQIVEGEATETFPLIDERKDEPMS